MLGSDTPSSMLAKLFSGRRAATTAAIASNAPAPPRPSANPIYPPFDAGLPLVPVAELLQQQSELLRRLKLAYGVEQSTFNAELLPIIERVARFVHLLPATPTNYFRSPAGLLRMSLEIAFYGVQAVDATLFQGLKSISQRQLLEPRWRMSTFIAGLCAELHRSLGQVVVIDDQGVEWPPFLGALFDWAQARGSSRYHLRWIENQQESRALGLFAMRYIVTPETMQYLATGNSLVVPHMLACITGAPLYRGTTNVLDGLIRRASALVIDTELRSNAEFYGQHQLGAHLERYLVDGLRRLVAGGDWTINGADSPAWLAADGAFLLWPRAAEELVRLLERDQLTGIPKNAQTILEILVSAKVVHTESDASGAIVQIRLPSVAQPTPAVRLTSESVLTSSLPAPAALLANPLIARPGDTTPVAAVPSQPEAPPQARAEARAPPLAEAPPSSPAQQELSLTESNSPTQREGSHTGTDVAPTTEAEMPSALSKPPPMVLRRSPRLNAAVHRQLSQMLGDAAADRRAIAGVVVLPDGVFIALGALKQRGIDTAQAIDALDSAGFLQRGTDGAKTELQSVAGDSVLGIRIPAARIENFAQSAVPTS